MAHFYSDPLSASILLCCLDQCVHYSKSPHSHNNGRNLEVGWGVGVGMCLVCMCGVHAYMPPPAAEQVINSEHCPPVNSSPLLK